MPKQHTSVLYSVFCVTLTLLSHHITPYSFHAALSTLVLIENLARRLLARERRLERFGVSIGWVQGLLLLCITKGKKGIITI